jgi:hypothetical protein
MAGPDWQAGRACKAAAFIIAEGVKPFNYDAKENWEKRSYTAYEPESGFEIHGDIEYFYLVMCENTKNGSIGDNPIWNVAIYLPTWGGGDPKKLDFQEIEKTGFVKVYEGEVLKAGTKREISKIEKICEKKFTELWEE